jgi:hypothetical protein
MSNTKRDPLFSHAMMRDIISCGREDVDAVRMVGAVRIAGEYEVLRAKDAELIQRLVEACRTAYLAIDSLNDSGMGPLTSIEGVRAMSDTVDALADAEAAGYKPSDQ